jgi:hypothetical protein
MTDLILYFKVQYYKLIFHWTGKLGDYESVGLDEYIEATYPCIVK